MSTIHSHQFDNGLALLVEPIDGVTSAAMTLLLPAGVTYEPADRLGVGAVLAEMMLRGAGDLDARAHSDALDALGVHRSTEVTTFHTRLGAVMMGDRIDAALPLLLDTVRRPRLEDQSFTPAVQLAVQAIEALDDDPQDKVMIELKRRHLGEPLGRSTLGDLEHLRLMRAEDVRRFWTRQFVPRGAILAMAGAVEFEHVRDQAARLLGEWGGSADSPPPYSAPPAGQYHVEADTSQQHIGVAYPAVSDRDPKTMTQRLGVAVLSGGMSGRLFTEVRENRGLCYSVYASYVAQPDHGTVYAYAGTTTARAAETRAVLIDELRKLGDGVSNDEFERAAVGLKAKLVMQGESTSARAAAIAGDQFRRGRPRTLEEIDCEVDAVTLDDLNEFLAAHRPTAFTTLNVGPQPLNGQLGA